MIQQNSFQQTLPNILCCICGTLIESNPSNMCVQCIRNQIDISDGIPKQLPLIFCKSCGRFLNPPSQWLFCDLESKELLALCIKRVKGLNKVKLVDAGFIWTEPHSMRIKVKLTIQKEVFQSTILQQTFIVEFILHNQQCEACQRTEAKDTWNAVVQLRQKVEHKKTFFFLEQLILKYNVHTNTTNIKERSDGLDFYFSHKNHASKFVDFIQSVAPVRFKVSEKLISHDEKNNTANIKYSFSVEIIPLCRDDLVCLPKKLSSSLGNINPLLLCDRVTSFARLIDPLTLQTCDITSQIFWNSSFRSICSSKQLIEYIILDIVPLGPTNGKYILADVQCVRAKDFGVNDNMFFAKTHLGHILKPGDSVLGYDLSTTIFNDSDLTSLKGKIMPDLILVKKCYPKRSSLRYWKLKTLDKEKNEEEKKMDIEKSNKEYEEFLKDIEEDPELRSNINLYKTKNFENIYKQRHQELENEMTDEKLDIELEELLDDLTLEEE